MSRPSGGPTTSRPRRGGVFVRALRLVGRGLRAGWLGLGVVLLWIVAIELALTVAFGIKDRVAGLPLVDPRLKAEGYGGETWIETYTKEDRSKTTEWHPYVYFRERPFDGETIRIDDRGRRRTWRPEGNPAGRPKVLFLGGSAAWGVGARDDYTIPSLVAKRLAEEDVPAEVENLAEIGYVNTQEWIALALELRRGSRPDVVVFYDGVNEVLSAYQAGEPGLPQNESNRRREFADRESPGRLALAALRTGLPETAIFRLANSLQARLSGNRPGSVPTPGASGRSVGGLAEAVVDLYDANRRLVAALADDYRFRTRFYWQPALYTKSEPTPFERDELAKYAALEPLFLATYASARARAGVPGDDFVDLSGLLDDSPKLLFTDFCHTTEAANAIVAEAIVVDLLPMLLDGRTK